MCGGMGASSCKKVLHAGIDGPVRLCGVWRVKNSREKQHEQTEEHNSPTEMRDELQLCLPAEMGRGDITAVRAIQRF